MPQQMLQSNFPQQMPQQYYEEDDIELHTMLLKEIKKPMIVVILYAIFQSEKVNSILNNILPRVQNSYAGLVVKAIIVGFLYYIIDKCI